MFVLGNPRRVVAGVRKDCTKCRRIRLKTVELKMAAHAPEQSIIAPPFYAVQVDIAHGFNAVPWKKARNKIALYALVIVCVLTSATSILALEGISCEDVVAALERHSARHGVPGVLYVDNGTQLTSLGSVSFTLQDLENKLQDWLDLKIVVSCPKVHEERGRVERSIRLIREMLEQIGEGTPSPQSPKMWETTFARVAYALNDLPIAKGNTHSGTVMDNFDIITPNRILLGRNKKRGMSGEGIDFESSANLQRLLAGRQEIFSMWYHLYIEIIHLLNATPGKWKRSDPPLNPVVLGG